jgi:hypothetical protein
VEEQGIPLRHVSRLRVALLYDATLGAGSLALDDSRCIIAG